MNQLRIRIDDVLVHSKGHIPDEKFDRTGVYEDKQAKNTILLERKIADKTRSKEVLRFKWEKIY